MAIKEATTSRAGESPSRMVHIHKAGAGACCTRCLCHVQVLIAGPSFATHARLGQDCTLHTADSGCMLLLCTACQMSCIHKMPSLFVVICWYMGSNTLMMVGKDSLCSARRGVGPLLLHTCSCRTPLNAFPVVFCGYGSGTLMIVGRGLSLQHEAGGCATAAPHLLLQDISVLLASSCHDGTSLCLLGAAGAWACSSAALQCDERRAGGYLRAACLFLP